MKRIVVFLLIATTFSSCVSLSDLIYVRNKDNNNKENTITPIAIKPYRLQIYDVLNINIKALDQNLVAMFMPAQGTNQMAFSPEMAAIQNGFIIDDHGNIRIPVIGEMNVLGFTAEEIRIKIEKELLDNYFKKEAEIFVTVRLAGIRYTINGEIGAPGTKVIFQDRLTVLEAIANSGDITVVGDRKNVTIMRQFSHGIELHDIDLTDLKVMNSPYYFVQPNDYIYVKPLAQKTWGTGTTGLQSLSTIITLLSLATTTYLLLQR
jgi:polysaccharide export outer membrane protein